MTEIPHPWLRLFAPCTAAEFRLICFPHAGGSARTYQAWPHHLPATVELFAVQYPGREDRFDEPFITGMAELADRTAEAVTAVADRPTVLFGHSMGGAVAHEVAKRLNHNPRIEHLVISGRQPPKHHSGGHIHLADTETLCAELLRLSEANRPLVSDTGLREIMFPIIRADYRLIETYPATPARALTCPITAFLGTGDQELTEAQARDWRHETTGPFALRRFAGDHFYLIPQRNRVIATLLATVLPQPSTP